MSDYHREYADQADARIRELEDKLAGAVEVLNGAGVKMCELIDQLAAYKVAVGKMGDYYRAEAELQCTDFNTPRQQVREIRSAYTKARNAMWVDPICKAAINAAKEGE